MLAVLKRGDDGITLHVFCSSDLDLHPMTFIYELDPKTMKIYTACATMKFLLFLLQGFGNLSSDRNTDIHTQTICAPVSYTHLTLPTIYSV